jgi:hypothetical protein
VNNKYSAEEILILAQQIMKDRGSLRDCGTERSMERIVKVFNALTDNHLNEVDGWTFMVVLKLCRERTGSDVDNWVDGAAYMALAAEAVDRQN